MTHYVFFDMKGYILCVREKRERERERDEEGKWYYRRGFVL